LKVIRRIGRVILVLAIVILSLLLTVSVAIQIPAVQTRLAQWGVEQLNKTFNTKIDVESVDINFFGRIYMYGLTTKDDRGLDFIKVKQLETSFDIWSLLKGTDKIDLKEIELTDPQIKIITYKGDSTSNFIKFVNSFSSKEKKEPSPFTLKGNFIINNGELLLKNENLETSKQVWVDAKKLNVDISDFALINDDLNANVNRLAFETMRKGELYVVKQLSGKAHYNSKEIRVDNLLLQTNDSNLQGNLVLDSSKENAMKDFVNKVIWTADIHHGTVINFKDIRYFADNFDKNSSVKVYGLASGPLNDLTFENIELADDNNYISAKNLQLKEVLKNDLKLYSKSLRLKTSYQSLKQLLPTFIAQKIPVFVQRFGTVNYEGDLVLNTKEIALEGNAITGLGRANINAVLSNYTNPKAMLYKGVVDANDLDLRQITEVKDLGLVSGKLTFNGIGTDLNTINLDVDGNLKYLDLMGKRYHNLAVDGLLKNYVYDGKFVINDPNLKATFDGNVAFKSKPYRLNFESDLNYIDLDYLGLTKNLGAKVKAKVKGDFSLSNLDDFVGDLSLVDLHYQSKTDTLNLAEAFIDSEVSDGTKIIHAKIPDYLEGEISGKFVLSEIVNSINNTLVPIIPSFRHKKVSPNQEFTVNVFVEQNILKYINPEIVVEPNTSLKAYINSNDNSFRANLDSPGVAFGNIKAYNALVSLDTTTEDNKVSGSIDSLMINKIAVRDIKINSIPKNDSLMINTNFNIGKPSNPMKFDLNLFHTMKDNNTMEFGFASSTFNLDSNIWTINQENSSETNKVIIDMNSKRMRVEEISLNYQDQRLVMSGFYNNEEDFNFDGNFEKLVLSKLIPKDLLKGLSIDGIANGDVNVVRNAKELKPTLAMKIDQLKLNDFELGNLSLNGGYNNVQNVFDVELSLDQGLVQSLYLNGFIDNNPETPELNVVANFDEFNVGFVEGFLSTVFSNMRGTISGEVQFDGKINQPNFQGDLAVRDLGFKINYLGTDYLFDGVNDVHVTKIGGSQGTIMLDNLVFRDTFYKTKGLVDGAILFRGFSEWFLNLSFSSSNLLVMNTTAKDNEMFYGRVFADGYFDIFGPVQGLDIVARADVKDNSELTINTSSTIIESEKQLVRFVPNQDIVEDNKERTQPKGMTIDLLVNAYPTSKVNLILDAATNDMATARGTAENLGIRLDNSGINITGNYNIESGTYNFRQSGIPLLNKNFSIQKGSNINFSGNPLNADLDITAVYERTISNVGEYLAGAGSSQLYDGQLKIYIKDNLQNPKIDYDIEILRASSDMNSQLASKLNNQDEKTMQFVYILMTGKFGDTTTLSSNLQGGVASGAADIGLSAIAGALNSLLGGVELDFQYIQGSDGSYTNDKLRYSLSYQVNNRMKVSGSYGMAVTNEYQENFDGNLNLQYDVSRLNNGSLLVNLFTRPTTFGVQAGNLNQLNQSFGAGVSYNTSFNSLKEVFRRIRGDERKDQIQDSINRSVEYQQRSNDNPIEVSDSVKEKFELDTVKKSTVSMNAPVVSDKKYLENQKKKRGSLVRF